jgi:phosphoenolpyruvate synthase/pyruvate phosphate dikinase
MPNNSIYCPGEKFRNRRQSSKSGRESTLGIQIPNGFAVTRQALTDFLEGNELMASEKNVLNKIGRREATSSVMGLVEFSRTMSVSN